MRLVLKNPRIKQYNLLAVIIAWIHTVVFIIILFSADYNLIRIIAAAGLAIVDSAFILRNKFRGAGTFMQPYSIMYYCLVVAWPLLGYYWVTPIIMLITVLDILARQTPIVYFSAERIEFPSIPKKIIRWNELSNVVLKDSLLTIDFKNDKLLQSEVERGTDEEAFNISVKPFLSDKLIIDN